jgi:hypothetical protein
MAAARNDGTQLESLVKLVEGIQLPAGFTLKTNRRLYDESGNQLVELDIVITGTIGSVTYRTLFECRDRPSEGKAEGAWIEQLYGRKYRYGFNEVIAVSTTGFAPSAIANSAELRIPLRTVDELTADQIRGFLPMTAPLIHNEANPREIYIGLLSEALLLEDGEELEEGERQLIPNDEKVISNLSTNQLLTLNELWKEMIGTHSERIFSGVPENGEWVEKIVELGQNDFASYRVVARGEQMKIAWMKVTGSLRRVPSALALVVAATYGAGTEYETVVATWKGDPEHDIKELSLVLRRRA